jgi:serralysin
MAGRFSSRLTAARYALLACALLLVLALTTQTHGATNGPGGSLANSGRSTLVQPDGKILVVGHSGEDFGLARYTADGALDKSFSGNGKLKTDFSQGADEARTVVLGPGAKILVAGHSGEDLAVARYKANGKLDRSFSGDGKLTTDFIGSGDDGQSCVVQPNGKILVVGNAGKDFALARFKADGTLDESFSGDGKQTTDFAGGSDSARAVSIRGDGKILVAGRSGHALAFARYNADGTLDKSFSGDGKLKSFTGGTDDGNSI